MKDAERLDGRGARDDEEQRREDQRAEHEVIVRLSTAGCQRAAAETLALVGRLAQSISSTFARLLRQEKPHFPKPRRQHQALGNLETERCGLAAHQFVPSELCSQQSARGVLA